MWAEVWAAAVWGIGINGESHRPSIGSSDHVWYYLLNGLYHSKLAVQRARLRFRDPSSHKAKATSDKRHPRERARTEEVTGKD